MTVIRAKKKTMSLEWDCLRNVTKSGFTVSCPLEKNRPKQYFPHPVARRKAQ